MKEECLLNGNRFAGVSQKNFVAGTQPRNWPIQIFFGNDSNTKIVQDADNLAPELPQKHQPFIVDHFPVVFLHIHLSSIQTKDVWLDTGFRPRSVFEYLYLVQRDDSEWGDQGYPRDTADSALTLKPPLGAVLIVVPNRRKITIWNFWGCGNSPAAFQAALKF